MNAVKNISSSLTMSGNSIQNFGHQQPGPDQVLRGAVKIAVITGFAMIVTLALFWLMSLVTAQSGEKPPEPKPVLAIDPVFKETHTKVVEKETLPPQEKVIPPPKIPSRDLEPNESSDSSLFNDEFALASPKVDTSANTTLTITGGEARPIVRISPQYPIVAARDGVEGWVQLSFSINEMGGVEDIVVVDAEPKRTFNKEAKRALRKWKYRPKMVDGKPVKQVNMSVQLDFKLEGSAAQ